MVPSRANNQRGRGPYRLGINPETEEYALFKERDNKSYKRITGYIA
jgi:hypothetical protein